MQWFIANRQMEIVCFPSTDSPESLTIYNDLEERSIETFNGSYSFSVDGTHKDAVYVEAGNYILFRDQFNKTRMYTIITVEDDGEEKSAYCEDIGLDLINESRSDFSASEAKPITYYFDDLLFDTGWKIRVNEVAHLSRKLEWQGTNTAYNRILSVLNSFDKSEVEFVIEISGNFIIHQYVDIFKAEHGKGDIKQKFIDTVNLKNLRKTTDIKNIGTCIEAKGGKIEGAENDESVSLVGFEYDDGVYFSPKNDNKVYSRKAKKDWSRYQVFTDPEFNSVNRTETGGHILVQFSYDTQSQEELFNRSLSKLKEVEQLQVTYEAEVIDMDLKAGDYVQIADHKRNPPIYLEARVLETSISYTDPSKDNAKFGNYEEITSDTTQTWQDAMKQLEENIKNAPVYTWQAYADDKNGSGISLFPEGKKYLGNSTNQKAKEADISDPSVYKWALIKGEDGQDGESGRGISGTPETVYGQSKLGTTIPSSWSTTRPNVPAGEYLWTKTITKYTDNTESSVIIPTLMGPKGEQGVAGLGIKNQNVEYAKGTSGTVPPASGWSTTIPTVNANEYFWTRTTLTYTNNTSTIAYSVSRMGANGSDAKLLYLTATAENIAFNADDTPKTTQAITISAKLQNTTGTATFKAIPYIGNTAQAEITLGGSGNNRTLSPSQWTNANWTLITITATLDGLSDTLSVTKVKDGETGPKGDDGLPAYVHPAWANSPDGTVDFTTVYPGENLMTGGKEFIAENTNYTSPQFVATGSFNLDVEKLNEERCLTVSAYISVKNSQRIQPTGAFRIGYEGTVSLSSGATGYVGVWHNGLIGETFSGFVKSIYKLPDGVTATKLQSHGNIYHQQNGEYLEVSHLKIEYGNNPDPIYTPSPQDDPIGACMKYMGTCSNHSETAPTDPSAYHWEVDPTYLEHSKVNGNDYENDKDTIYEALEDKANSDELNDLKNSADKLIEDFGTFTGKGGTYEQGLIALEGRAVGLYKDLGDKLLKLNFINTWFKVGEEGLVIGTEGSNIKMLLNNESLSFLDGGKVVAYFTNQNFYINKGAVVKSLQVGSHAMISLGEEDTVIQFVGGAIA